MLPWVSFSKHQQNSVWGQEPRAGVHDDVRGDVKGEYEIGLIAHKKENHVLIPTLAASFTPYAIYHTLAGFIPPGSAFKAKASKTAESRS